MKEEKKTKDDGLMSIFNNLNSYTYFKINFTTPLNEIEDLEMVELLKSLYESKDPILKRIASVLNACYTQGLTSFLLSKRILERTLVLDENYSITTCNSQFYTQLMHKICHPEFGFLDEMRKADARKAGLFKVRHKALLNLIHAKIGREVCDRRDQIAIEVWEEEHRGSETGKLKGIPIDEVLKMMDEKKIKRKPKKKKKDDEEDDKEGKDE